MNASWDGGVPSHFLVTLTSDLVSRIGSMSGAYLLYSLRWGSHILRMDASLDSDRWCTILGHCDLDL